MSAISTDYFSATFSIETEHKHRLEFVLDEAKHRNAGRDYLGRLWDMMRDALKLAHIDGAEVAEQTLYGDVSYRLNVTKQVDLIHALNVCQDAAADWIRRYRINSMKDTA